MNECKFVLAYYGPLLATFDITDAWYTAPLGVIPPLTPGEVPSSSHAVCLVGYDESKSQFKFVNSWGAEWGDNGFGYIRYDSFEEIWSEGWFMDDHGFGGEPSTRYLRRAWGLHESSGTIFHCCEFVGPTDERIAWAFAVEREEGKLEVEELFVRPHFRRKRYGTALIRSMAELATERNAKLELWISYADDGPDNLAVVEKLLKPAGLHLQHSGVRWAPLVANTSADYSQAAKPMSPLQPAQRPKSPIPRTLI